MKRTFELFAILVAALLLVSCKDENNHDYYVCNVLADSLVVDAEEISYLPEELKELNIKGETFQYDRPINIVLHKNDKFSVSFYGKRHKDYSLWGDYNYLVVDGKVVGKDTRILFNADTTQVKLLRSGHLKEERDNMTGKEYRSLLKMVAPQKIKARTWVMYFGISVAAFILLLAVSSGLIIVVSKLQKKNAGTEKFSEEVENPETQTSVLANIGKGLVYLILGFFPAVFGLLYFLFNPTDSLWFITDAGGFGWLGFFAAIIYFSWIAVFGIGVFFDKEQRQEVLKDKIWLVCVILTALVLIPVAILFVKAFWSQAQYIIWSVVVAFFAPAALSSGGSALMSGGGSSSGSSVGDDSYGEEIELGSGRKIGGRSSVDGETFFGNDGKTYSRKGMGSRTWESDD